MPRTTSLARASISALALALLPLTSHAHPVTFPGGTDITLLNTSIMRSWSANYSFTHWLSAGAKFIKLNHALTSQAYIGTVGLLPWRGNFETSQANFYLTAGAGVESALYTQNAVGYLSPEADWENRFVLVSAKYEILPGLKNTPRDLLRLRAGVAAFEGTADSINVWLLLQADYHTLDSNVPFAFYHPSQEVLRWQWTPMVRVTYQNTLAELGMSDNGATHLNFKVHF